MICLISTLLNNSFTFEGVQCNGPYKHHFNKRKKNKKKTKKKSVKGNKPQNQNINISHKF